MRYLTTTCRLMPITEHSRQWIQIPTNKEHGTKWSWMRSSLTCLAATASHIIRPDYWQRASGSTSQWRLAPHTSYQCVWSSHWRQRHSCGCRSPSWLRDLWDSCMLVWCHSGLSWSTCAAMQEKRRQSTTTCLTQRLDPPCPYQSWNSISQGAVRRQ